MLAVNLIELGKNDGPEVLVRFKICEGGSTDWVGWILGARAIDCPENGGLGHIPMAHSHSFTALGIQTERTESPGRARPDSCYAVKLSVLDSDSDEDGAQLHAGGTQQSGPSLQPAATADPSCRATLAEHGRTAILARVRQGRLRSDLEPGI